MVMCHPILTRHGVRKCVYVVRWQDSDYAVMATGKRDWTIDDILGIRSQVLALLRRKGESFPKAESYLLYDESGNFGDPRVCKFKYVRESEEMNFPQQH